MFCYRFSINIYRKLGIIQVKVRDIIRPGIMTGTVFVFGRVRHDLQIFLDIFEKCPLFLSDLGGTSNGGLQFNRL